MDNLSSLPGYCRRHELTDHAGFERGVNFIEAVMKARQHALIEFVPIWMYKPMKGFYRKQLGNDFGDLEGFEGHISEMACIVHHYLVDGWGLEDTEGAGVLLADQVNL